MNNFSKKKSGGSKATPKTKKKGGTSKVITIPDHIDPYDYYLDSAVSSKPTKATKKTHNLGSSVGFGYKKSCYHSHKPLKIKEGIEIFGGSCIHPVIEDADIYVGFDKGMTLSDKSYPWNTGIEFLYFIQDMSIPKDPKSFKLLIGYLAEQLELGKKVHIGCIGGHGRTGLVLSALVTYMTGNKDSITYVRKNYCSKAVETQSQVKFLHDNFGVKEIEIPEYAYGGYMMGAKASFNKAPIISEVVSIASNLSIWGD